MKIVVAGASGLIGTPLVHALQDDGHEVVRLVRREPTDASEVRWDPATGRLDVAALRGTDAAVNLAGAGVGDRRWTRSYRHTIRASRTDSTSVLARALAALDPPPAVLVNASGIGVYGHRGDEVLTEQSSTGDTFLAGVCRDWEAAAAPAQDAGIRVVFARSGLVMSPDGGAFGRLLRLFRLGLGGPLGDGRMWWSWITMADEVAALRFLLVHDVHGPVNLTGPEPVRNAELTAALGRALHRPAVLPVPRFALHVRLGAFAEEVTASQRVLPRALLEAGFSFQHTDVDQAARWLVRGPRSSPRA